MNHNDNITNFMGRPYMERQVIIVSNKAVIKAAEEAQAREIETQKPEAISAQSVLNTALKAASVVAGWEFILGKMLVGAAVEAYSGLKKAQNKGATIRPITYEQAERLKFPPGHPREGVVYVCHPAKPDTYYTMGDFHRIAFEHKFSEAMTMLMSLGATSIDVVHVAGWSTELLGKLQFSGPTQAGTTKVNVESSYNGGENNTLLFRALLAGSHTPRLPDDMSWYPHEPLWQSVATGRLKFGLNSFSLTVSYNDDFGINSKLSAVVGESGLDIGGKFENHKATVWKIEGNFEQRLGEPD